MLWNWELQRTQYSTVILASLHRWINQTNDHYFVFQIINLWSIGPSEQMIRELSIRLWWSSSWTCKRNTAAVRYKPLSGPQTWSTPFRWFILHSRSKAFLKHFTILIIFQLLLADLPSSAGLLEIAPVYKRQQESWDKVFNRMAAILSYWVSPFCVIFYTNYFRSWESSPTCCCWSPSWPESLLQSCHSGDDQYQHFVHSILSLSKWFSSSGPWTINNQFDLRYWDLS